MNHKPVVGDKIYNIEISVELSFRNLSFKDYMKIQKVFYDGITDMKTINFKELDKILALKNRIYRGKSIEFPELRKDVDSNTTKIEIIG